MKRFKYLFLLTLLGLMFFAMPVMASGIQVVVDGKVVEFTDQKPYIDKANRTQVPLRAPMEAMGCEVSWNDSLQQAVISKDDVRVEFIIGSNKYTINDVTKTMDTTATITGNRTCIPIRYAAEAFGTEVDWIADKKAVAIYTKKTSAEEKQKIEKGIPEVPSKYTVSTESIPNFNRENIKVYRTHTLPIDTGDTTVLALEHKIIDSKNEKLLITVDRAEDLKRFHVYFGKDIFDAVSINNRTNFVYWDKKDKDGNYILEISIKTPAGEAVGYRVNLAEYEEIGFETTRNCDGIYYLKNPFKK